MDSPISDLKLRYLQLLRAMNRVVASNLTPKTKAEALNTIEENKRALEREIARELGCEGTHDLRFLEWVHALTEEVRRSA